MVGLPQDLSLKAFAEYSFPSREPLGAQRFARFSDLRLAFVPASRFSGCQVSVRILDFGSFNGLCSEQPVIN